MQVRLEREESGEPAWMCHSFRYVLHFRINKSPGGEGCFWSTTVAGEAPWDRRAASVESLPGEWRTVDIEGVPVGARVLLTAHARKPKPTNNDSDSKQYSENSNDSSEGTLRGEVRLSMATPVVESALAPKILIGVALVLFILIAYFALTAPFILP